MVSGEPELAQSAPRRSGYDELLVAMGVIDLSTSFEKEHCFYVACYTKGRNLVIMRSW